MRFPLQSIRCPNRNACKYEHKSVLKVEVYCFVCNNCFVCLLNDTQKKQNDETNQSMGEFKYGLTFCNTEQK